MSILPQRGMALLVLLLSAWLAFALGRSALPVAGEAAPAVVISGGGIQVMLGEGFVDGGVHQFSDGIDPVGVIKMTQVASPVVMDGSAMWLRPLVSGERLDLIPGSTQIGGLRRGLMTAEARMLLGIPLHPDRMTRDDWQALPGIGPKLAEVIELDRQINGDFRSLEGLGRVKGVGPGRLKSWRPYF